VEILLPSRFKYSLAGISAGAAVYSAIEIGKRIENKGKRILVIIPDTGERYISSGLFANN